MDELVRFVSLAVSICAAGLSYFCFRLTQKRAMQPVLAFSVEGHGTPWYVENVGNGPALNITLAGGTSREKPDAKALRIPALARGGRHVLHWVDNSLAFVAEYSDVNGRLYKTTAYDNANQVSEPSHPSLQPTLFLWQMQHR